MKISWKWLGEMVDLSGVETPQKLADLLTHRGLEVEEVRPLAQGLEKVITAQIVVRNKHPDSDRLSLCKVTIGKGDPLEIVCGAQNMKSGDKVALAMVGAQLPNGMAIAQSKIRGVVSNGMLCSEEELKFKEKSDGILILPESTPLGRPLAEALGLDDVIFTLKLTANRADCLSHLGVAREVAAALHSKLKYKMPELKLLELPAAPIAVKLEAGESSPQFYGIAIDGVKIGPSPSWMVRRLEGLGQRSINNVVDATNLVMLELGQPMHAYDADKIEGKLLKVRPAQKGEKIPLLDGQTAEMQGFELVISDGKKGVGLAGVMGGGNSEVSDATKKLFLEAAEFAPGLVRRASTKHQRKTEAAHRFERGVDPTMVRVAIVRLAQVILKTAGGKATGCSSAALASRDPSKKSAPRLILVEPDYFARFLGFTVPEKELEKVFVSLECGVQKGSGAWKISPPPYRLDLNIKEDLAEEVARTVGYDKIPSTIPVLTSAPTIGSSDPFRQRYDLNLKAKRLLAEEGLYETVNYGFTSMARLKEFGLSSSVKVVNPLSEEFEYMVPSLLPGLISQAQENARHHFGSEPLSIRLFEMGPTFTSAQAVVAQGEMQTTVEEKWKLGLVLSGPGFKSALKNDLKDVDFSDLRSVVDGFLTRLGAKGVRYMPLSDRTAESVRGWVHPGKSVEILAGQGSAGFLGLLHPARARALKLRAPLWIAELDWEAIAALSRPPHEPTHFKPWPEFPPMERDFALVVKEEVTADRIVQIALKTGRPLAKVARIFDVYKGSQVQQGMTSIAVRVIFYAEGRSLQESETEAVSAQIVQAWQKELGAELRG
ncbi:phenylalanine--tRNA ligase subunit beta [bacterium]|nr:phenylalanine--tRNA ligase subunit beta [bacterium]